jgi:hypothetical protein
MNVWPNPFMRRANRIDIKWHRDRDYCRAKRALSEVEWALRLPILIIMGRRGDRLPYNLRMEPYAKPNERKVGANRPKITHLPADIDQRTRSQRRAEKQAVAAERRAIKKAARQQLQRKLRDELEDS